MTQQVLHQQLVGPLVFSDQYARRFCSRGEVEPDDVEAVVDAGNLRAGRRSGSQVGRCLEWQAQRERGPLSQFALKVQVAAEKLGEPSADGQSQPGAALLLAAGIGLVKCAEQFLLIFRGNARSRVGNLDAQRAIVRIDLGLLRSYVGQSDKTTVGELDRIAQQVEKDLA